MSGEPSTDATVLVVDDEQRAADTYASALGEEYEVLTAYGGREALSIVDDDVDVVLLDRRMSELSGDEVLEEILHRKLDCRVAMVTAVNPDFDILELGFDDYVVKPVGKDGLLATVERLLAMAEYDETHTRLSSLQLKRNVLALEKSDAELDESEEFERLEARIDELEAQLDDIESTTDIPDQRTR
ncbi:response regulator [Halorientalis salina]|uniref:response regulator n=1 Tax=Halorientalis salina TaxID=2932266 RepID=UPI0010AC7EE5|nr:response regulator [Halorientalis salina]